ncbi:UDP-2,4-diacetamido-2,4,6-trideoxy-beta-L-altropyranose hydrolase [Cohnella sp.]|uniref:UDP-2,4-diacetamido-2,4, 6-trideoxy-beta-L-altropyranose hydrolase n=1 Tax=Cohnella sp. TaxID=1883426 RepID=UPI0035683A15
MRLVVFRVDASVSIGTGHVMRCLTLADAMRERGYASLFICRRLNGNLGDEIEKRGYRVIWIDEYSPMQLGRSQEDAAATVRILKQMNRSVNWLIIDHYEIDRDWEAILKPYVEYIMVIDDLANRSHLCDLLLDQNLHADEETRYRELVPLHCKRLIGPRYLLLSPSFYSLKRKLSRRQGRLENLLVFFGGSDPTNETVKALKALSELDVVPSHTTVIIGSANPNRGYIRELCGQMDKVRLYVQVDNMAEHIAQADFALGAGGVAMWERCFLGLPSAITIVADNQKASVDAAEKYGAVWSLGWHDQVNPGTYRKIVERAMSLPDERRMMNGKALELFERSSRPIVLDEILALEES